MKESYKLSTIVDSSLQKWTFKSPRQQGRVQSVLLLSRVRLFATPWTAAHQASLSFTISLSFLKLMSFESEMPSDHLILCHPLFLPPSIFPSIRVFPSESALCTRRPKAWNFSFVITLSNAYSGQISFRVDWFDFLTVHRSLKSLLQHHSLKASVLWPSAFFIIPLLHPCMAARKTIALTLWTFTILVMSLLFNTLV